MTKLKTKASPKKGHKTAASASTVTTATEQQPVVTNRQHMIAEAAYFIAEHRGFAAGDEIGDWLQAEREVDTLITV